MKKWIILSCIFAFIALAGCGNNPASAPDNQQQLPSPKNNIGSTGSSTVALPSLPPPSYDVSWGTNGILTGGGINSFVVSMTTSEMALYVASQDDTGSYVEKRDAQMGVLLWRRAFGITIHDGIKTIASDGTGVYAVGFTATYQFPYYPHWHMEKYDAATGTLMWEQTVPSIGTYGGIARSIAMNINGEIYVAGNNSGDMTQWRIEKRDAATGNLIWVQTPVMNGVNISDEAYGVAVDDTGVYILGTYLPNMVWAAERIEKRDTATGNLIWANDLLANNAGSHGGIVTDKTGASVVYVANSAGYIHKMNSFDGSVLWSIAGIWQMGGNYTMPFAITADTGGIYIVGQNLPDPANPTDAQWRVEKLDSNGMLMWERTSNPSSNGDGVVAVTADSSGLYVGGYQCPSFCSWRIEKTGL